MTIPAAPIPVALIPVAIIEDDRVTRESLVSLLNHSTHCRCLWAERSAENALARSPSPPPAILLLDIQLPGQRGTDAIPRLLQRFPSARVLMLTVFDARESVFEAIQQGACGYVLKNTPAPRLIEAIQDAAQGYSPMSPEIARFMVEAFRASAPIAPSPLTEQERSLLALLAEGHGYDSAGDALGITINTVRNHIRSIYEKLQVRSKNAAVGKGIRMGWIR